MILNARIMWAIFAANGAKKKGGGKWSIKDFLPPEYQHVERPQQIRPISELVAMAKHLNAMYSGTDKTEA